MRDRLRLSALISGRLGQTFVGGGMAALIKVFSLCVSFVSVPLLLSALGTERYGVWLGIYSIFVTLLSLLDFGIGSGVVTPLAHAVARGEYRRASSLVALVVALTGLIGMATMAAGLAVAVAMLCGWLSGSMFGIERSELPLLIVLLSFFLSLALPLSMLTRAMLAMNRVHVAAVVEGAGQLLVLGALIFMVHSHASYRAVALMVCFPPLIASIFQLRLLRGLGIILPSTIPRWRAVLHRGCTAVRAGMPFLALQAAGISLLTLDTFLANCWLSPQDAADVGVSQRLFQIIPVIAGFALAPMWPAFAAAAGKRDWAFVRRGFITGLALVVVVATVVVGLFVWGSAEIFNRWLGTGSPRPEGVMLAGYAAWAWIAAVGGMPALLLNGLGMVRFQVFCAIPLVVCTVPVKLVAIHVLGASGLVWGAVLSQIVCVVLPSTIFIIILARRGWKTC